MRNHFFPKSNALGLMAAYYRFSSRNLRKDRYLHAPQRGAVLVEDDSLVLMARPVSLDARLDQVIDPEQFFPPEICDAWFIHLMIGCPARLPELVPHYGRYERYCYIRGARQDSTLHSGIVEKTMSRFLRANK